MKSYRKELWFNVPGRRAFINITPQVQECLRESGIENGLALVNAMHITASVFINDDERGLHQDYEDWLEELAPHEPISHYRHNRTGKDNSDAHLKRQIMGRQVVVAITGSRLDFGPWEQIFYDEFDRRRRKRVLVKITRVSKSKPYTWRIYKFVPVHLFLPDLDDRHLSPTWVSPLPARLFAGRSRASTVLLPFAVADDDAPLGKCVPNNSPRTRRTTDAGNGR
jgi:secondary thiamine-phosphate synthase enzyme